MSLYGEYHKINTMFKRDMEQPGHPVILGSWTCPEFAYLAENDWVFTEKVDGTNIRVEIFPGGVAFGGKTDNAQIPALLMDRLNERFLPQIDLLGTMFAEGACLYGEGYGPKIQKGGGLYRQDQDFVLFDVRVGEWWLQRTDVEEIAGRLGLDVVPIIGEGTLWNAVQRVKDGIRSTWGDFPAEGIVARPKVELKTCAGHRIIMKIKTRDFKE